MKTMLTLLCLIAPLNIAFAKPAYTGPNFSGVYTCQGDDAHEGQYSATVTLTFIPAQSVANHGAYTFKLVVPDYGVYLGHAATEDNTAAIYFALSDPTTQDFGTGIAQFKKNSADKWTFNKFYYEPEFKGGNYGFEVCTQQ